MEFGWRNVASYGNKQNVIKISEAPELVVVFGENGTGKTAISDVITFANYGKLRTRKIAGFANRTNSSADTYSIFRTEDNRIVETHRGLKPDFFNITIDGKDETIKDMKKIKAMLENELIAIPFEVFANTLLLSIKDFDSFVGMDVETKRRIVDRIFGIDIFNIMKKILNENKREPQDRYIQLDTQYNNMLTNITEQKVKIVELQMKSDADKQSSLDEINRSMAEIQKLIDTETQVASKLSTSISSLRTSANAIEGDIGSKINNEQMSLSLQIASLDSGMAERYKNEQSRIEKILEGRLTELKNSCNLEFADKSKQYTEEITAMGASIMELQRAEESEVLTEKKKNSDTYSDALSKLEKDYDVCLTNMRARIDNAKLEQNKLSEEAKEEREKISVLKNSITNAQHKVDLFNSGKCPECDTDLTTTEHVHRNQNYVADVMKYGVELEATQLKLAGIDGMSDTLNKSITLMNRIYFSNSNSLNTKKNALALDKSNQQEAKIAEISNKYRKLVSDANANIDARKKSMDQLSSELGQYYDSIYNEEKAAYSNELNAFYGNLQEETSKAKLEKQTALGTLINDIESKKQELAKAKLELESEESKLYTSNNLLLRCNEQIKSKEEEIRRITANSGTQSIIKNLEEAAKVSEEKLGTLMQQRDDAEYRLELYNIVDKMISEDGIKKDFMKRFIPVLNQNIYDIYRQLNFRYSFHFDENFNPVVTDNNERIGLDSLSAGESKEIDIMALLAFIPLIKLRNPYTNLLFLDEIFYSLDKKNTALVVKLLKDFTVKYNMTIFVISHMDVPSEYFDKMYQTEFTNGFSELKVIK